MNEIEREALLKRAIGTFGKEPQMKIVIEEMAELQKEICKNLRGVPNVNAIAQEMAEVEIMLAQMKIIFNISGTVEIWKARKLKQLEVLLNSILVLSILTAITSRTSPGRGAKDPRVKKK